MPSLKITGSKKNIRVLGIGVFDGVHLGHQDIVSRCDHILTFSPHPDGVLNKRKGIKYLSTLREQRQLIKGLLVCKFTPEVSQWTPEVFFQKVIVDSLKPNEVVVGEDFGFGAGRAGNLETLQLLGNKFDIKITVLPLKTEQGQPIKSSVIRNMVSEGKLTACTQLMGRGYLLIGIVIRGESRGRKLGFPTANLQIPSHKLLPKPGVYAGWTKVGQRNLRSMIYIGKKPTFHADENEQTVEVHLLDFDGDLYGKQLAVSICIEIREEQKFESVSLLIDQIQRDIQAAKTKEF